MIRVCWCILIPHYNHADQFHIHPHLQWQGSEIKLVTRAQHILLTTYRCREWSLCGWIQEDIHIDMNQECWCICYWLGSCGHLGHSSWDTRQCQCIRLECHHPRNLCYIHTWSPFLSFCTWHSRHIRDLVRKNFHLISRNKMRSD